MVMRELSPLPISLLSGFSINLCLKLAYQMEESMFLGQVWDLVTGRLLQTQVFPLPITAIVVDPTEMKLFSGGIDY
ncbi:unnamed protein product [Camellia sinensis]